MLHGLGPRSRRGIDGEQHQRGHHLRDHATDERRVLDDDERRDDSLEFVDHRRCNHDRCPPTDGSTGGCVPDCEGKTCGDDGCGGDCGTCGFNTECSEAFACEELIAGCEDTDGYQPGSPWPTLGYCETRRFQSPLAGPTSTPSVAWSYNISQPLGDIVVSAEGIIYGGTEDGILHAVDAASGTETWTFALGSEEALEAPAIAADGSIFDSLQDPSSQTGSVFKVSPDGDDLWEAPLGTGTEWRTSPLIGSDGTVYVMTGSSILGLEPDDGAEVFESNFANSEFGTGGIARGA